MTGYPHLIPANDPRRVAALQAYHLLGTDPDALFDEIVRLTAKLFDVPVALISLVSEQEVEFQGNYGLPGVRKVSREDSICSVAVLSDTATVYENLHADPCHLTNQAAADALNLGFYAGHPLHTADGYNIGALCVIDHQPRQLSVTELTRLATMAGLVVQLFELRVALEDQPPTAAALWEHIYRSIDASLTRIDTLRALDQWEESTHTTASQGYQQAINEEALRITQTVTAELEAARAQLV